VALLDLLVLPETLELLVLHHLALVQLLTIALHKEELLVLTYPTVTKPQRCVIQ
jgi:hypothetical protein